MQPTWNISLFHYPQPGRGLARILVGMQVPPKTRRRRSTPSWPRWAIRYVEETLNPYRLFLPAVQITRI